MTGAYDDGLQGHYGMDVQGNLLRMVDVMPCTSNAVLPSSYFPPRNIISSICKDEMEEIRAR